MVKALIIRNLFYGYSIIMPMPDQDEESRNEKHYVMDLALQKRKKNLEISNGVQIMKEKIAKVCPEK